MEKKDHLHNQSNANLQSFEGGITRQNPKILISLVGGLMNGFARVKNKWNDIAEHLSIAIFVIIIAHYAGEWIHAVFS